MFSKMVIAFFLVIIGLTSTLAAPAPRYPEGPITGQRPVFNEGGLLPDVSALLGDLTTGLNGALGGRPKYVPQGYVPVQNEV